MPKLENYFFIDINNEQVLMPNSKGGYVLIGDMVYKEPNKEKKITVMVPVKEIIDNAAYTESGLKYELGQMHPDYIDLMKAIEEGIPIITSWSIKGRRSFGYSLKGCVGENEITGVVTSQEGNYVILNGNTKYFVIWHNLMLNPNEKLDITFTGYYRDLKISEDFSEFLNQRVKPNLMG